MKFNHIGIFSKNIKVGKKILCSYLNIKKIFKIFYDKNLGVKVIFITDTSNITYEIVAPYGKKNPVKKLLDQNKNILNHVAYKVKNFDNQIKILRQKGFAPLNTPKKAKAFRNKKICFFLTPLSFIIEIIEDD